MQTDVVIIGAGTAGLAAAREVRKQTQNFLILDPGPLGTTCARVGCMPSKLLIEAANAYHRRLSYEQFGIRHADKLEVDMSEVMQRVRELRDFYVNSTLEAIEAFGAHLISASATVLEPHKMLAGDDTIEFNKLIIATGSRPQLPVDWEGLGSGLLTSDNVFEQSHFASDIAVIGLGAIGIEIAQALSRLGSNVTAFGAGDFLAGVSDEQVNQSLLSNLQQEFNLQPGKRVELERAGEAIRVTSEDYDSTFEQVIAAIGRRPNLDQLGLEKLGLSADSDWTSQIDPKTLQLADLPVFVAGDARGHSMLLHEAADDGHIAGHNAVAASMLGCQRRVLLHIVFCQPEVALVGQRRAELQEGEFISGQVDFSGQGRARAAQRNAGLLVIYASKDSGIVLGAEMAAPAAGHLAHILALAIQQKLSVNAVLAMPIYHPVLEEGLRTALRQLQKQLPAADSFSPFQCEGLDSEALD